MLIRSRPNMMGVSCVASGSSRIRSSMSARMNPYFGKSRSQRTACVDVKVVPGNNGEAKISVLISLNVSPRRSASLFTLVVD